MKNVNFPEPINATVTRAAGSMEPKPDFINRYIDPVKNIKFDHVNF